MRENTPTAQSDISELSEVERLELLSVIVSEDNKSALLPFLDWITTDDAKTALQEAALQGSTECFAVISSVLYPSGPMRAMKMRPLLETAAAAGRAPLVLRFIEEYPVRRPEFTSIVIAAIQSGDVEFVSALMQNAPTDVACTALVSMLTNETKVSATSAMAELLISSVPVEDIVPVVSMAFDTAKRQAEAASMAVIDKFIMDLPTPMFLSVSSALHQYIKDTPLPHALSRQSKEAMLAVVQEDEKSSSVRRKM